MMKFKLIDKEYDRYGNIKYYKMQELKEGYSSIINMKVEQLSKGMKRGLYECDDFVLDELGRLRDANLEMDNNYIKEIAKAIELKGYIKFLINQNTKNIIDKLRLLDRPYKVWDCFVAYQVKNETILATYKKNVKLIGDADIAIKELSGRGGIWDINYNGIITNETTFKKRIMKIDQDVRAQINAEIEKLFAGDCLD